MAAKIGSAAAAINALAFVVCWLQVGATLSAADDSWLLGIGTASSVLIAAAVYVLVNRGFNRPMADSKAAAQKIASGDRRGGCRG